MLSIWASVKFCFSVKGLTCIRPPKLQPNLDGKHLRIIPLPNNKYLDWFKLKAFADDKMWLKN